MQQYQGLSYPGPQALAEVHFSPQLPKEACGVVFVGGTRKALELAKAAQETLQHRGELACGMVGYNPKPRINDQPHYHHRGSGLVKQVFDHEPLVFAKKYNFALGHNRYATAGGSKLCNAQPLYALIPPIGDVYIAHNGNLTNSVALRAELKEQGCKFQTSADTEIILHLIAQKVKEHEEKYGKTKPINQGEIIEAALQKVKGSYSLLIMTNDKLFAIRDPNGFRPLVMGRRREDNALVIVSESVAFEPLDAEFVREIKPGELCEVELKSNGKIGNIQSRIMDIKALPVDPRFCAFEWPYFANPASKFAGELVMDKRAALGKRAAKLLKGVLDLGNAVIVPVPDSGRFAGEAFAKALRRYPVAGLIRNQQHGRSFTQTTTKGRENVAEWKRFIVRDKIEGKDVILVDDSLVRGNTTRKLVKRLRAMGAKSVTLVVAAPPIIDTCIYGIDLPSKKEMIANKVSLEKIAKELRLDALYYLPLKDFKEIIGKGHCFHCFDGVNPQPGRRVLNFLSGKRKQQGSSKQRLAA